MKKFLIILAVLFFASFSIAQDTNLAQLKANHEAMIKKMGDIQFLSGTHYFAYFMKMPTSVFAIKNQKCVYAEYNDRKLYRVIICTPGDNKVSLSFSDKLELQGRIYTLNYSIAYVTADRSGGYFVTMDKDNSDLVAARADWAKILECVLKYAGELYGSVKQCLESQDLLECLKIIGPATEVYKCISESILGEIQSVDRAIVTQTISFSWSWGYSTGFKAAPIYKEMPYPVIGFDSVNISHASNAWNIRIEGSTTGNNVAKVILANVTFMCYPTFWSSSVSGSIRCVMQKP